MRLDHFLALTNIGTKKKVKALIYQGDIEINQRLCTTPAFEIDETQDIITCKGIVLHVCPRYYLLNKPQNCITAREEGKHTVFDCIDDDNKDLFAVGRLDKDTEGLLIITNDGQLNHKLMNPDYHIPKTYLFLCLGIITPTKITLLESGLDIGNNIMTKPAQFRLISSGLYSDLSVEIGVSKMKRIKTPPVHQTAFLGELVITEGKKHQVKRMMRAINCPIVYLKRTAIGGLAIPKDLSIGSAQSLSTSDLDSCFIYSK